MILILILREKHTRLFSLIVSLRVFQDKFESIIYVFQAYVSLKLCFTLSNKRISEDIMKKVNLKHY